MPAFTEAPILSVRFSEALSYAHDQHIKQIRKQSGVPYISHQLAVSSLVLEMGGDENQAIAALLHDAVEDAGVSLEEISSLFGGIVAALVWHCTDEFKRGSWASQVQVCDDQWMLVKLADALHNARCCIVSGDKGFVAKQSLKYRLVWFRAKSCLGSTWAVQELERISNELASDVEIPEIKEGESWIDYQIRLLPWIAPIRDAFIKKEWEECRSEDFDAGDYIDLKIDVEKSWDAEFDRIVGENLTVKIENMLRQKHQAIEEDPF